MSERILQIGEYLQVPNVRNRVKLRHFNLKHSSHPIAHEPLDIFVNLIQENYVRARKTFLQTVPRHSDFEVQPPNQITYLARDVSGLVQLLPMTNPSFTGEFGFVPPIIWPDTRKVPAKGEIIPAIGFEAKDAYNNIWGVKTYAQVDEHNAHTHTRLVRNVNGISLDYAITTHPCPMGISQLTRIDLAYSTGNGSTDSQEGRLSLQREEFKTEMTEFSLNRAVLSNLADNSSVYLVRGDGQLHVDTDLNENESILKDLCPHYEGIPLIDGLKTVANILDCFTTSPDGLIDNAYIAFKQKL